MTAVALTTPGHDGKTYTLTGPEPLGRADLAAKLAAATGKPIRFVDIPEAVARDGMAKAGVPEFIIEPVAKFWAFVRAGKLTDVTPTVRELAGRTRTFDDWARENAARFG